MGNWVHRVVIQGGKRPGDAPEHYDKAVEIANRLQRLALERQSQGYVLRHDHFRDAEKARRSSNGQNAATVLRAAAEGAKRQPSVTRICKDIACVANSEAPAVKSKSLNRTWEKIVMAPEKRFDVGVVLDVARGSVVCPDMASMSLALDYIENCNEILPVR